MNSKSLIQLQQAREAMCGVFRSTNIKSTLLSHLTRKHGFTDYSILVDTSSESYYLINPNMIIYNERRSSGFRPLAGIPTAHQSIINRKSTLGGPQVRPVEAFTMLTATPMYMTLFCLNDTYIGLFNTFSK